MATHSSILAWRIPMEREAWWATGQCHKEWDMTEQLTPLLLSLQTFRYTRNDLGQCFILWKERLL